VGAAAAPARELPLFGDGLSGDAPLVRQSAPSQPLSVRRSTPPARSRPSSAPRRADVRPAPELPLPAPSFTTLGLADRTGAATASDTVGRAAGSRQVAGIGPRLGAAAVDWLMLLGLDLAVLYFTLRVSRLDTAEVTLLPALPLLAFLLLLNGGYLAMFTAAGGQTLGKMLFRLRVVSSADEPVSIGRSLARAAGCFVSVLPAGMGLLPAVFDRGRRGLHDRLAGTRVIDAGTP
jgi:uncharacterized RDD family membrane protein YckC